MPDDRAIHVDESGVRLQRVTEPLAPDEHEIRLRMVLAAVWRGDVHGPRRDPATVPVPGRSMVGLIDEVPGDAAGARPRDPDRPVVPEPLRPCARCARCRAGLGWHCPERLEIGVHGRPGVLADRVLAGGEALEPVPDGVEPEQAVWAVATSDAMSAASRVSLRGRGFVSVLTDGPVGLLTAQCLAGALPTARVLPLSETAGRLCEQWSIPHRDPREAGRRADQDAVVVDGGGGEAVELALRLVRPRGVVLLVSRPSDSVGLGPVIAGEIRLEGVVRDVPISGALRTIAEGRVLTDGLAPRRVRLGDPEALTAALRDPEVPAVLVAP